MMSDDKWCPENDGAYRAELAEIHRHSSDTKLRARIADLDAQLAAADRLVGALRNFERGNWSFLTDSPPEWAALLLEIAAYRAIRGGGNG